MKKILFVCSGNTCRSPLAEGIARSLFPEGFADDVSSAGSSALDGLPASSLSIEVAQMNAIDIADHKARLLSRALVMDADLIVTMGWSHRETVGIIEPAALAYTFLLTDFCDDVEGEVPDPIGHGTEAYESTFELIDRCLRAMSERLDAFDGWKQVDS